MKWLIAGILGIIFGSIALLLSGMETRWIIYICGGISLLVVFLAFPEKETFLVLVFIFSLQFDIYLRFFYGRAGSTGIAIPLTGITGFLLLTWMVLYGSSSGQHRLRLAGSQAGPIIAILATTILSLLTTSEKFVGLSQFIFVLSLYQVYWLGLNIVRTEDAFARILRLLFIILGIQCIVYIIQSIFGLTFTLVGDIIVQSEIPRPGGTVSVNPAGFASFIIPTLLITMAIFLAKKQYRTSYINDKLNTLLLLLGTICITLTFTRAVWVGYLLGFSAILYLSSRHHTLNMQRLFIISITVAGIAFVAIPTLLIRITSDYGESSAFDERMGLIRIALRMIEANPLTGVGPGAYGHLFKDYALGIDQWLFIVHNEFLLRAETGIPGGIAFIALLWIGCRVALRLCKTNSYGIKLVAIGWFSALIYLIWQMFWVPWTGYTYNAMLWLMLGLMDGIEQLMLSSKKSQLNRRA